VPINTLQLKSVNGAIGKWMQVGRGPEEKLMATTATEIINQWFHGLKLVDEVKQRELLSEENRKEWQRLVPFMVRSFQIARDMIQRLHSPIHSHTIGASLHCSTFYY